MVLSSHADYNKVYHLNTVNSQHSRLKEIRSRRREDQGDPVTGETQIDCPEYIVFQLNQGGSWELKEVDGLKSAQQAITKQGFHYKSTKAVVVLKDLEAVPYTLFAESDD